MYCLLKRTVKSCKDLKRDKYTEPYVLLLLNVIIFHLLIIFQLDLQCFRILTQQAVKKEIEKLQLFQLSTNIFKILINSYAPPKVVIVIYGEMSSSKGGQPAQFLQSFSINASVRCPNYVTVNLYSTCLFSDAFELTKLISNISTQQFSSFNNQNLVRWKFSITRV